MLFSKRYKELDITLPFLVILFLISIVIFGSILSNTKLSTSSKAQGFTCDPKSQGPCYTECGKCSDSGTQCTADLNSRCGPGFQVYETTGKCYCTKNPPGGGSISPTPTIPPTSTVLVPNVSGIPLGLGGENQECYVNTNRMQFCLNELIAQDDRKNNSKCLCVKPNLTISNRELGFTNCDQGLNNGKCNIHMNLNLGINGQSEISYSRYSSPNNDNFFTKFLVSYVKNGSRVIRLYGPGLDTDNLYIPNDYSNQGPLILYFQPYVDMNKLLCNGVAENDYECLFQTYIGIEIPWDSGKSRLADNELVEGVHYFNIYPKNQPVKKPAGKLEESCNMFEPCQEGLVCSFEDPSVCLKRVKNSEPWYALAFFAEQYDITGSRYTFSNIISFDLLPGDRARYPENAYTVVKKSTGDSDFIFNYEITYPDARKRSSFTESYLNMDGYSMPQSNLNGLYIRFYSCDGNLYKRQSLEWSSSKLTCNWSQPGPKKIAILGFDFSATPDKFDQALKTFNMTTNYSESHITKVLGDIKYPHKNELATPDIQNSVTFNNVIFNGIKTKPTEAIHGR